MNNNIPPLEDRFILFALNELTPEEQNQVENELKDNPELQAEVEIYRRMAGILPRVTVKTPFETASITQPGVGKPRNSGGWKFLRYTAVTLAGLLLINCIAFVWFTATHVQYASDKVCCYCPNSPECEELEVIEDGMYYARAYPSKTEKMDYAAPYNAPDGYSFHKENGFISPKSENFSTFGVDVDTASYTQMRAFIERGQRPDPNSVRIEEYINYFDYALPQPEKNDPCPFSATCEIGRHPYAPGALLAKIGIQGRKIESGALPKLNLTFLIDVSGSMNSGDKLPLVKDALLQLLDKLKPEDCISLVTYCGSVTVRLESTPVSNKKEIERAILSLYTGGGTYGAGGIEKAYQQARQNFENGAVNRVILCSDGDFNIGSTSLSEMETIISQEAKSGIFLTVLGFGMGNFKDNRMETLADKGNGNYAYIDSRDEARRVLVNEIGATMVTIAKDVKVQVDFNSAAVESYRLVGYENRIMNKEDFNNDSKDSGDIGAGHRVVALYEIIPVGVKNPFSPAVDKSRYEKAESAGVQRQEKNDSNNDSVLQNELFLVKLRYKLPDGAVSTYKDFPVALPNQESLDAMQRSSDFRFAAAVALYAQILRGSQYTNGAGLQTVKELLEGTVGEDSKRIEFKNLVDKTTNQ